LPRPSTTSRRSTTGQLREAREQLEAADGDLRSYIRDVESHLNVVIEMFERHLREDHGSKPS
jgi:hypothetical protein